MGAGDPDRGHRLHLHGALHLAHRRHAGGRPPDRRQPGVDDVHDAAGASPTPRARWSRSASAPATPVDARRLGWAGLEIGVAIAAVLGAAVFLLRAADRRPLHRRRRSIVAAALPLLAWVAVFHVADAAQTVAAFVLRAYRIATVPLVIYVGRALGHRARRRLRRGLRPRRREPGVDARRAGLLVASATGRRWLRRRAAWRPTWPPCCRRQRRTAAPRPVGALAG